MRIAAIAAAVAGLGAAACTSDSDDEGARCANCPSGTVVSTGVAGSTVGSRVTAVAASPGETPWMAGSYDQSVEIGGRFLGSDTIGDDDLFLARVEPRLLDAPYVGLGLSTYRLTAAGIAPDGEEGAVVVVYGDPPGQPSQVEAIWLDRRELEVERAVVGTVETDGPAGVTAVMCADPHGWPLVALSGTGVDVGDDPPVLGPRGVVVRIGQGLRRELIFDLAGVEILDIAAAAPDTAVIAGRYTGAVTPAGFPVCAEPSCGFVASIDAGTATGEPLRWVRVFHGTEGATVRAVAAHPNGNVAAVVAITGAAWDPPVNNSEALLYLAFVDLGGVDQAQHVLAIPPASIAGDINGVKLAMTAEGSAVLALSAQGSLSIAGEDFTSDANGEHDAMVAEIDPITGFAWMTTFRSSGDVSVAAVAVSGAQVAVGGSFVGNVSVSAGSLIESAETATQGYVIELTR